MNILLETLVLHQSKVHRFHENTCLPPDWIFICFKALTKGGVLPSKHQPPAVMRVYCSLDHGCEQPVDEAYRAPRRLRCPASLRGPSSATASSSSVGSGFVHQLLKGQQEKAKI